MRIPILAVVAAVLALSSGVAGQTKAPPLTLVKASRLLDVRAGVYRTNQGLWIEAGRIKQVGAFDAVRAAAPRDIVLVDLGNAAVLPGLIDSHTHLLAAMDPQVTPQENLVQTLTRESPARRALTGAAMARQMVEAGFTTVRNVGHSGVDGDVALRDAIAAGLLPGPRIIAAGRKITPIGGQVLPVQQGVAQAIIDLDFLPAGNPEEGRRAVLENLRVGADVIKVVVDDWPRVIADDTLKATVGEAHRVGIRVAAHATTKVGIQTAIDAGVDSIEHGDELTDEQLAAMKAKGIFLVPVHWPREILPLPREIAARPNIDALVNEFLEGERTRLAQAMKAGVKLAFGSDNVVPLRRQNARRGDQNRPDRDACLRRADSRSPACGNRERRGAAEGRRLGRHARSDQVRGSDRCRRGSARRCGRAPEGDLRHERRSRRPRLAN